MVNAGSGAPTADKEVQAILHSRGNTCVVIISLEKEFYLISMWQNYGVTFASTSVKILYRMVVITQLQN